MAQNDDYLLKTYQNKDSTTNQLYTQLPIELKQDELDTYYELEEKLKGTSFGINQKESGQIFTIKNNKIIKTTSYVGTISLSEKKTFYIKPRDDIDFHFMRNYLLNNNLTEWNETKYKLEDKILTKESIEYDRIGLETLSTLLFKQINQITKTGLLSNYIEETEESQFLKGKILWTKSFSKGYFPTEKLFHRSSYLTQDITENQILKKTLKILSILNISPELKNKINQIYNQYFLLIGELEENYTKIFYNSLNIRYKKAITNCENIIKTTNFLTDKNGNPTHRSCYMINMNTLFEHFIAAFLKEHLKKYNYVYTEPRPENKTYIQSTYFDQQNQKGEIHNFSQYPDIIIKPKDETIPTLILDTKNKRPGEDVHPESQDIIQILNYCNFLLFSPNQKKFSNKPIKVEKAILLYPLTEDIDTKYEIKNTKTQDTTTIYKKSINLTRKNLSESTHELLKYLSKTHQIQYNEDCRCEILKSQNEKILNKLN